MRKLYVLFAILFTGWLSNSVSAQSISLTGTTYSQDFNTLASTLTSSTLPAGWSFSESGTNANTSYTAGNGSGTAGDTYSFGSTSSTERALGGLRSGSLVPTFGVFFTNNTGTTVTSLTISYTGEQWRLGTAARTDKLDFQYSVTATSLTTGTWTDVNALDFISPNTTTTGALDGNAAANRTAISFTILGLSIPDGSSFFIRWNDVDATSSDDGLSIDDFSITTGNIVTNNVDVSAGNSATEPATNGSFNITITSPAPAGGVTVNYSLSGTAEADVDYTDPQAGSVTIPQGANSATVNLNVIDDAIAEPTETIIITLTAVTSPYSITTSSASIDLGNDDIGPVSLTGISYSQDFNSLISSGTGSLFALPLGWSFAETGTNANTTYTAGTGSSNSGDTYSFGATSNSERAFGSVLSGSLLSRVGAYFINNTGTTITALKISYTGEQWRLGATGRSDKLDFQYSIDGNTLTTGTWIDWDQLDFIAPNSTGTAGALDGNNPVNQATITKTIIGLSIPNGSTFLIRWIDSDASGADDGLGIDDFSILPNPPDNDAPVVVSVFPTTGSTNVSINFNASISFDETVQKGTGNILIRRYADDVIVHTIDINSAIVTANSNVVSFPVSNLAINTAYYIEIESGALKDLANNNFTGISGGSTWAFTTGVDFYSANFQSCSPFISDGFTQYSVTGSITWACTTFGRDPAAPAGSAPFPYGVQINGFAGGTNVPNVDWLISPSFDLTGTTFPLLSFWSRTAFNGLPLQLKVSTNYSGGDPATATWVDINGKFPAQTSNVWTLSSNINLSAFKQPNVHFAFVYTSSNDDGARWTLDDILIQNSLVPPPPSLTVSTTDIQYTYVASGATADKSFMFIGNDLTGNVELQATGAFLLSKDGSAFSSSLTYTVAEANNIFKTVFVRFAPSANNADFNGTITINTADLSEIINLKGTSIDPAGTLEVVNWNLEWFGSTTMDPPNDNQQEQNVKTILQNIGADVYGLVEVVDEARLANVVSQMPGYTYVISNYGSHTNTTTNPPSALAEAQKLAFVYKTSVFSNVTTTPLLSQGINSAADLTNPAYNYWASGRFPFMMSADVTLNCVTKNVKFVLVHAKANTSPTLTSYDRRKRGADTLHYTLNTNYPTDNILILGDYNDDLDSTITAGISPKITSWSSFTTDETNFSSPTLALSLAGKKSTVSYNDVIDHVMLSDELEGYYMTATANILSDVSGLVSNYGSTTTDHYPVFTRYRFENPPAPGITTCPVVPAFCKTSNNSYIIPAFIATSNCGSLSYSYSISGATIRSGNSNNASGTFNVGTSTILWTAMDGLGSTSTCATSVIVYDNPTVTIPDAFALPSGTLANTVYIGYSPASSITLSAIANGTGSFSYSWSNGGTSSATIVSPTLTTLYAVTVTDGNGCSSSATKTISVKDIRAGKNMDKVIICHKQKNTIVVSQAEVPGHLAEGDMLGSCELNIQSAVVKNSETGIETRGGLTIKILPNPSYSYFRVQMTGISGEKINLRIADISGRIIEEKDNLQPNSEFRVGDKYRPGIYFAEITQGNLKAQFKLVKIN